MQTEETTLEETNTINVARVATDVAIVTFAAIGFYKTTRSIVSSLKRLKKVPVVETVLPDPPLVSIT